MHAFIVRPFGIKDGIDFDRVERELICPALQALDCSGGTTGQFIQQGNIRSDMFEQLLVADLVIADISIHNANTFYELGIRHAFRDKRTFLIRSRGDDVPFDLKTDRYLPYDADDPGASLAPLIEALRATWQSAAPDSPVFQLLPGLDPADPGKFIIAPLDFREEVERAQSDCDRGQLQLLSVELDGIPWKTGGLRLIGRAQFGCRDWQGARATWEALRGYDPLDLEANTLLGTVYQRLGDLVRSDQSLERALESSRESAANSSRAELYALMGRNAKTLWERDWCQQESTAARQEAALESSHLRRSFELYRKGFIEDRNHYYSGLNALALLTAMIRLADTQPEIWRDKFELEDEAVLERRKLEELRRELVTGVKLAIRSRRVQLQREQGRDVWIEISAADLTLLSSDKPSRVGRAYRSAVSGASEQAWESTRKQLLLFQPLGILSDNIQAALDSISQTRQPAEDRQKPVRVILFTGHRIDRPDRQTPRFPAASEQQAREMIRQAVATELNDPAVDLLGIAGGASGGDILFHEVCRELGIDTRVYLAIPENDYIKASVADSGHQWVDRFKRLARQTRPVVLSDSSSLPNWLHAKPDYGIWQRSNLWMLHHSLDLSREDMTLIALWNGQHGDGPGGTEDMIRRGSDRGARIIHLDARELTR